MFLYNMQEAVREDGFLCFIIVHNSSVPFETSQLPSMSIATTFYEHRS